MKLSRQARRALCRTMAASALKSMPLQEERSEHRKSMKLLARRMFQEVPTHVADGSILGPDGESTFGIGIGENAKRIVLA